MIQRHQLPGATEAEKNFFDKLQKQKIIYPECMGQGANIQNIIAKNISVDILVGRVQILEERKIEDIFKKRVKKNFQAKQYEKKHKLEEARKEKDKLEKQIYLINNKIDDMEDERRKEIQKIHKPADYRKRFKYEKEMHKEEQQELDLHHLKIKQQRAEIEQKRKEQIQQEKEMQEKKLREEKERKEKERQERNLKRKNDLQLKYEKMQIEQQEREVERKQQAIQIQNILNQKPLYLLKQEEYKRNEERLLREKKIQLQNIRNLHKPLDAEELKLHEKKYMQDKKTHVSRYEEEKKQNSFQYNKPYCSENYKRFSQEISDLKKQYNEQQNKKPDPIRKNRIKEYSKNVTKPLINPKLQHERLLNIERTKTGGLKLKDIMDKNGKPRLRAQSQKQIGNDYLEYLKKLPKKKKKTEVEDDDSEVQSVISKDRQYNTSKTTRAASQPPKDYIQELRNKRMQREEKNTSQQNQWQKIVENKDIKSEDKETIILMEAERYLNMAERKEKLAKVKGDFGEEDKAVDEYYIKAIQAKMAVLELDIKKETTGKKNDSDSD